MRRRISFVGLLAGLAGLAGCTIDVPSDPASLLAPLENLGQDVARAIEDLVGDPLDSRPYPTLVGGDSERVLYVTNLGDIRLNFRGATNDIVIPGLIGPSNLYRIQDNERELIRPLVLAGTTFGGLTTDGEIVAYVLLPDEETPGPFRLVIGDVYFEPDVVVHEVSGGALIRPDLDADDGRVAFVEVLADGAEQLRLAGRIAVEAGFVAAAEDIRWFDLRDDRIAYAATDADFVAEIRLQDVVTGEDLLVADGVEQIDGLYLTNNHIVWAEAGADGLNRVWAHEIPTGETRLWADAVAGRLAGATDAFFVTEEHRDRGLDRADKLFVNRHRLEDGQVKEIADFRADGLAGQTRVVGDRIVFVNDERRIVLVPLAGGDRKSFAPF